MRLHSLIACLACCCVLPALAAQPADEAGAGDRLIRVDRQKREVRVRCQALRVDMPLEFFCVVAGTADHETVLRTTAKPSAVHAALLGMGLEPGSPLRFIPERKEWIAPHGPPVRVEVEWEQDGRTIRRRAGELIRNIRTGEAMPARLFVFSGSRMVNGEYAADATGQLVSLVNFEFSMLDVPQIASNANETLEWEINPDTMPPDGATVWMVLTAVPDEAATRPATTRAAGAARPAEVVVVSVSGEGEVRVNNEAVALAEAGQAVRQRMPDEVPAGAAQVRLSVPRGAHVDALGRLLAKLAEAEVTNVVFVPPEEARAARGAEAQGDGRGGGRFDRGAAVEVLVHDGGGEVTVGGMQMALANFVTAARSAVEREPNNPGGGGGMPAGQQSVSVRAATGAIDIRPIDIAAVHALLHVLGHEVTADYPVVAGSGEPGPGLDELRARWEREVLPQGAALRQAAATHYEVMEAYQQEINRLLDQADRLRREMDDLQARYNDLTTPKPTTAE